MTQPVNWTKDALVLLQKSVIPVQYCGFDALCHIMLGSRIDDPGLQRLLGVFPICRTQLETFGVEFFQAAGLELNAQHQAICTDAAVVVAKVERTLRQLATAETVTMDDQRACLEMISKDMRPKVHAAIDAFRAAFISDNMRKGQKSAQQSEAALRKLSEISRKIFFISVNASVEASRAGAAGNGFSYIAGEIRDLSRTAEASASELLSLADDRAGPRAH